MMKNERKETRFLDAVSALRIQTDKAAGGTFDLDTILGCIPYAAAIGCQEAEFQIPSSHGYPFDLVDNLKALGFEVRLRRRGRSSPRLVVAWHPQDWQ